ncbi:glycine receptor subunit alpha-3-like [Argiope bruennichi]|uniref:Glycine receptor subunit alpha-3 like protein n=1 Tax=Argiope bruennichi TaxID=94029 RepID=A0A8T0FIM5_ARGBR|nr:glycine receptor subunit alpha-3-like [Argiope bruennichi]KAF8791117.1 Glycine receptor subunit alpha-3 like protein [Argiope bruennichi]
MIRPRFIFSHPFWLGLGLIFSYLYGALSSIQGGLSFNDILPEDPKMYDKMKPPKKDGKPTKVFFHVTVMGLDSINEGSMTYAADIFFAQTWKDPRLRLPENMTSEYRLLEVQWLENMWRPDSYFKNAKSVTFQTMTIPNHYVWLYQNKDILYMVKLTLTLSCAMNFATYPHDTQTCSLQMESLSYTTDDLLFDWEETMPLAVDENIELPQLDLVKTERGDCTQVYSTGNFTCLQVIFTLKRRLGYYLFHTYIPTCLIVIMSWVSFWIKPEAVPARVTLGVTSLLTLSTQHAKSQASLPPVSYIKAIDIFMSSCTFFVFLSLMEYALVNVVLEDEQATFRQMNNDNTRIFNLQPKLAGLTPVQKRRKKAIKIDRFSRILFPLSFIILNISYWVYYVGLL